MSLLAALPSSIDHRDLKTAYGRFTTGVAFVAAEVDGTQHGLIVSSFAAVSLTPALISFCPGRASHTWPRMRAAGQFDVHLLSAEHAEFARRAGPRGADRFAHKLEDPLATFACDLEAEHPAGDHRIVIGRVRALRLNEHPDPLVYFTGNFHSLEQP
jgi:3-hydroxy-9,10-secoandrosta-1,3,5(10)-triene-9,17-dione monooxygenase reductase component